MYHPPRGVGHDQRSVPGAGTLDRAERLPHLQPAREVLFREAAPAGDGVSQVDQDTVTEVQFPVMKSSDFRNPVSGEFCVIMQR